MGFFKSLLGIGSSSHERLTLQDSDLGTFTALNSSGNRIIWNGLVDLMDEKVSLHIQGEKDKLDASQKGSLLAMLNNVQKIDLEVNKALKEQYDHADKEYSDWKLTLLVFLFQRLSMISMLQWRKKILSTNSTFNLRTTRRLMFQ